MRGPIPCPPSLTLVILFLKKNSEYNKKNELKTMETYEGACFLPIFLTLVLKEIKKKEIKKGDLREGLLPFLQILVTTSHPLCPRSHHYQRCHQKFALFRSYCGKPSSCIGWRSQGDFGQGLLCVHDRKPVKSTKKNALIRDKNVRTWCFGWCT